MSGPYELVVFDLDGVLIDSRRVMELSWEAVQARFGLSTPFTSYFELIGRPFPDIMSHLGLTELAADIEPLYMATSLANFQEGLQFAGVDEMLEELERKDRRLAVVTSKDGPRTATILKHFTVHFDVVRTPEVLRRGKPAPDGLLSVMSELGVDPVDTIFIGDMPVDHQAAKRAHAAYGHAQWGYGEPDSDGCLLIAEPAALVSLVC